MDPQGITLILGAIGTSAAAVITAVGIYRGKAAPHSAILGAMKLLWNWLDFTAVTDDLIDRLRAGGSITSVIPDRVKIPVLRVVDPDQLKAQNRRASRVLEEDDQGDEVSHD